MEGSRRSCQKKKVEIRQSYCNSDVTFYSPAGQVGLPWPWEKSIVYKNKIQITQNVFQMLLYPSSLLGSFIVNGVMSLWLWSTSPSSFLPSSHTLLSPLLSKFYPFWNGFVISCAKEVKEKQRRSIYNPPLFPFHLPCLLKKKTSFLGFAPTNICFADRY